MKKHLILFAIISIAFLSCKKIKERKIPGIYNGTLEFSSQDYLYDDDGPTESVFENWTKVVDREVVVLDGHAFILGLDSYKIPLNDFDNEGKGQYVKVAGLKMTRINISKEKLTYELFRSYSPGSTAYEEWSELTFTGTRIE